MHLCSYSQVFLSFQPKSDGLCKIHGEVSRVLSRGLFVVCEIVCVRVAVRMCGCQCIYVRPAECCASLEGQDGQSYATSLHTVDCVL